MIIIFNDSPNYPNRSLGAYRIATALRRQGLEVEVIDYLSRWERANPELLFRYLDKISDVDWWGFSGKFKTGRKAKLLLNQAPGQRNFADLEGFIMQCSYDFEMRLISYIRSRAGKIVVGGPNAETLRVEQTGDTIDYLVEGYADIGVLAIHNHIKTNSELKYTEINGMKVVDCDIDYKDIDLSTIDVEYHKTDFIEEGDVFPIEIARGCIFQCAFCNFAHLGKKPGTYIRSKNSIKKDILDRYLKYKSTKFLFVDDTFNDSIEKMQIIKEIREETGIPFEFWSYCRLDLLRAKPEMVDLIDKIGWTSLTFGVETMHRPSGQTIGKGADPEKLKQFLIDLRKRFPTHKFQVNIILGLPHDTEEIARETVQWFMDHPDVATTVRIRPLSISDKSKKKTNSLMSKEPEKYGYTVTPIDKEITVKWISNSGMSLLDASKLTVELQDLINEHVHHSIVPPNVHLMYDKKVVEVDDETGTVTNNQVEKIRNYIRSKRKYRQV